jgi:NifU-like protein involved in Fe-S cluster formation
MDEAVIKYYRRLLRTGFEYAGSFTNPSLFLDFDVEGWKRAGCHPADSMHIFINVTNGRIDDIKYLCLCNPTVNVVIEVLCALAKGKGVEEAQSITEDSILQAIGTGSEDVRKKARALLEFLNKSLTMYQPKMTQNSS